MSGTVKWFNVQKGYGFITGEDGNEYFVHQSSIKMEGFRKLRNNWKVTFELGTDKNGKTCAVDVTPQ